MRSLRALAVAGAMLSVGCSKVETTATGGGHPWTRHGELRVAMTQSINTLNPFLSTSVSEGFAAAFALEGLIATGAHGRQVPVLAADVPTIENGGVARDGRTITYHLRPHVTWQDGVPFTSRDVAFSFHAVMNPNTNVITRHGYDLIERIDTPDPLTVVLHMRRSFGPAVATFFAHSDSPYAILPEHLLGKEHDLNRVPFNSAPIGTGPYKVVRWQRGERIDLEPYAGYHGGTPGLKRVTIRFVPDENTAVSELRAHEVDFFYQPSPRSYPQLTSIAGVKPELVEANQYFGLMLNTAKPLFADPRVRRAFALAIDKKALVASLTFGTAVPATEDLPPLVWGHDPTAGTTASDPAQAKRLLAEAGWQPGPDGMLRAGGKPVVLDFATRSDALADKQAAVVIAEQLRHIGIATSVKTYTTGLLYGQATAGGILAGGKYDIGTQTWYAGSDPDDSSQLLCSEVAPHGYNWSRYCSPAMDAAQHRALDHVDRPTRTAAYHEIERLLARDNPEVYVWWMRQIQAYNDDLKGFEPNGIVDSWNAGSWTI